MLISKGETFLICPNSRYSYYFLISGSWLSMRSILKNCAIAIFLEVPISSLFIKGRVTIYMKLFPQNVFLSDVKSSFGVSSTSQKRVKIRSRDVLWHWHNLVIGEIGPHTIQLNTVFCAKRDPIGRIDVWMQYIEWPYSRFINKTMCLLGFNRGSASFNLAVSLKCCKSKVWW